MCGLIPLGFTFFCISFPLGFNSHQYSGLGGELSRSPCSCKGNRVLWWKIQAIRRLPHHRYTATVYSFAFYCLTFNHFVLYLRRCSADDGTSRPPSVWWPRQSCHSGAWHQEGFLQEVPLWAVSSRVKVRVATLQSSQEAKRARKLFEEWFEVSN